MKRLSVKLPQKKLKTLFLFLFCSSLQAQDQVFLRVERNAINRIPLEIRLFELNEAPEGTEVDELMKTLENDLVSSSLIAPYLTVRGANGHSADKARIRTALNTIVAFNGGRVLIRGEVVNRQTGRILKKEIYRGCLEKLDLLIHKYADDVVNTLTGQTGVAKSRIAFAAKSYGGVEIYVMDYDGGNLEKLTDNGSLNLTPAWRKTAAQLSFTSFQDKNPDLYTFDFPSGKTFPVLQRNALFTSPAWSPTEQKVAFVSTYAGNAEIYVLQARSQKITRLTYHHAIESAPAWAPTGREIVFSSDRLGKPQLYIMSADGGNVRRIETGLDYNDSPVWSPRGDKIAFVARQESTFDIYVYDVGTHEVISVTQNAGSNEDPCWSPDGYMLAFTSTRDGQKDVYTMGWDGTDVKRLTQKGTCASPAWSPNIRLETDFDCSSK